MGTSIIFQCEVAVMTRRELARRTAIGAGVTLLSGAESHAADPAPVPDATGYVAGFILDSRFSDIPAQVLELARKSILDGIGLALSGSIAETGSIVRKYLETMEVQGARGSKGATVIGASFRALSRFAAFANGVGIHADDYDDTQLAVAKDRVYGLLTHPTAPVLPAALAIAEIRTMSGRDLLLAYNLGVEVETKISQGIQ